ncbi:MAG TPA: GntR family transcriptional regulator [Acidimicrobiales bacterium]|nr:GntR family transcriptional regulator [Acidimicrobiales bacterium]
MDTAFDNLTLAQRVYRHLRAEIRERRLEPGSELSEVALSKELGVSRGPIREAMGRLATEGLVTVRPRRGAVVRAITVEELVDAYLVREVLESMAVRLAVPRLEPEDLARLEALADEMEKSTAGGHVDRLFEANSEFHQLFCELSGNRKLHRVHHTLMGEMGAFQDRTLSLRGDPKESVTEHRAILRAARRGDATHAAELAAAHVRVPFERLQDHIAEMAAQGDDG